jgi:hypothetical protein
MVVPARIDSYKFREFTVVLARSGDRFLAVGRDAKSVQVAHASALSLDEVTSEIKRQLTELSNDYVGVSGAIKLFLKAFPEGFSSEFYVFDERSYKDRTVASVAEKLSEERMTTLLRYGDYGSICAAAKETMNNLVFPNERMAFSDALKQPTVARSFAESLFRLLYRDFNGALEELSLLLKPFDVAKWPILTFWPFFRFPERHMFLKPTIYQSCAHQMGHDPHYAVQPNPVTYASLLEFAKVLSDGLVPLAPKDYIDVQTFMYVIGSKGYVQDTIKARLVFEARGI